MFFAADVTWIIWLNHTSKDILQSYGRMQIKTNANQDECKSRQMQIE